MSDTGSAPPGWYTLPDRTLRWWDGSAWGPVAPPPQGPPLQTPSPQTPPPQTPPSQARPRTPVPATPPSAPPHHHGWGERRAEKRAVKAYEEEHATWAADVAWLTMASTVVAQLARGESQPCSLLLKPGEQALWTGEVQLVEPRRGPGHYSGQSQGFSFRVTKNVRYRVGANRGTFIPGDEVQTVVDEGTATVTTQRVVFAGSKATREWLYAKLLDTEASKDTSLVLIHVSNRQKVSGVKSRSAAFAPALEVALTVWQRTPEAAARDLADELSSLRAREPRPPVQ